MKKLYIVLCIGLMGKRSSYLYEKGFNLETYIKNLVKAAHGIIRGLSKIVTIYCSNLYQGSKVKVL